MSQITSAKQRAWARFIESRYANNWDKLDEATKNALKQSWWGGWAACQYRLRNKKAATGTSRELFEEIRK